MKKNKVDMNMKKNMADMKNTKRTYVLAMAVMVAALLIITTGCDEEKEKIDADNNKQLNTDSQNELFSALREAETTALSQESCLDMGGVWNPNATPHCDVQSNIETGLSCSYVESPQPEYCYRAYSGEAIQCFYKGKTDSDNLCRNGYICGPGKMMSMKIAKTEDEEEYTYPGGSQSNTFDPEYYQVCQAQMGGCQGLSHAECEESIECFLEIIQEGDQKYYTCKPETINDGCHHISKAACEESTECFLEMIELDGKASFTCKPETINDGCHHMGKAACEASENCSIERTVNTEKGEIKEKCVPN
ncbi:hypothetical protein JXB31_02340 [Candidatus Woesearchaeota archaeon]|nr:hypothetical protein [Candidatus Woesearchaeota archaeon]